MLELSSVHTYYGESHVLQGVTLEVPSGRVVAILGRNGAGKTTLVRTTIGFTPARRGAVRFKGDDITHWPPYRAVERGMALVPQGRRVFPSLSVIENLQVARRDGGRWTLARVLELFPRLRERGPNRAGKLSGGEQQMLAIGRALMTNPELLLMDEPTEGLAPLIVRELVRICSELAAAGQTILLVEQNLAATLALASRVYIINNGHVAHEGPAREIKARPELLQRYLGI